MDPQQPAPVPDKDALDPPPVKPEAPLPSDCCESGCEICVYDYYAEELRQYQADLARWRECHPGVSPTDEA